MIRPLVLIHTHGCSYLLRSDNGWSNCLVALIATKGRLAVGDVQTFPRFSRCTCRCKPLMFCIRNNLGAIRETDRVTFPLVQNRAYRKHTRGVSVRTDEIVTLRYFFHCRPAGRRRQRGIERERLALTRACP